MQHRRRAAGVIAASLAVVTVVSQLPSDARSGSVQGDPCASTTTTTEASTTTTTEAPPTTTTEAPPTTTTEAPPTTTTEAPPTTTTFFMPTSMTFPETTITIFGSADPAVVECETTTTTSSTTTTTEPESEATTSTTESESAPTTSTTTTTVSEPDEPDGAIEIPADQSRATVRPGGDVEVSVGVEVEDDERAIEDGTELAAEVKVAEGDTQPLFAVRATVADGRVSFDVSFPEDTDPGVYLVVIVLPGLTDQDGNTLRRPRVAIATVVVRGRAASGAVPTLPRPVLPPLPLLLLGAGALVLVAVGRRRVVPAVLAASVLGFTALPASATADATATRHAGTSRYDTAQALARAAFGDLPAPILTTGEDFPDALAASYLAGGMRAPILLTPKDELADDTLAALINLGANGVEIIGGPGAISENVVERLEAAGYATTRLAGVDRYDTARQIGTLIPPEGVGTLEELGRTAVVVSGTSYADALTASPMSYSQGWPVFLTGRDQLHEQAAAGLEAMGIEHVVVVGGTDVVGDGVVADLEARGIGVERLAGVDRVETSLAVAEFLFDRLSYDANDLALVRGDEFPDALVAGVRGGDEVMPVLLTASHTRLGIAALQFISDHRDLVEVIEVIGGQAAVPDALVEEALDLARR